MNRPFNISHMDHIVLRVAELSRSLEFYVETLGGTLERELPDLGLYQVRMGQQLIDLVTVGSKLGRAEPVAQINANVDHYCLICDTFDESELRSYLTSKGLDVSEAGERYGAGGFGVSVYVNDPDGNTVELKQPGGRPL